MKISYNCIIRSIFLSLGLGIFSLQSSASEPTFKASLDSAYIIMGKQTTLHLEITEDSSIKGNLPIINSETDTIIAPVEIIKRLSADTADLGNNRRQIKQDIIIQSFDSGLYTLPPILYTVGNDTFKSNELVLKVIPVPVDSMPTIHGQANVIAPNTRWYDFLPDFITDNWGWILLAILIITGAVLAILFRKKEVSLPLVPRKKPIPPYELAMQQLVVLRDEKLCERGQEKEFYTRLTDILRVYIDTRFGINAMEMTSTQIVDALNKNAETAEPNKYMRQILEIADFVKFAKVRPLPDDNVKSFNWATKFVEDTKPVEINEAANEKNEDTNVEPKVKE